VDNKYSGVAVRQLDDIEFDERVRWGIAIQRPGVAGEGPAEPAARFPRLASVACSPGRQASVPNARLRQWTSHFPHPAAERRPVRTALFLVSSGLTLVFGIMGVINIAHGSFYMIGAYLAWSLTGKLGSFWIALPVAVALTVAIGLALEALLIKRLYDRDHLYQVLLTYGLILVFEETRSILWGDDVRGVPIPEILSASIPLTETLVYPVYRLWISAVCLAVAGLMYWTIQKMRLGMMIRAGAANREMVQSLGVNIQLVYRVFAAGITRRSCRHDRLARLGGISVMGHRADLCLSSSWTGDGS
jgi:hypothetical protein